MLRVIPPHVLPQILYSPSSYTLPESLAFVSQLTFSQLANLPYPLPQSEISDRQFYKATVRRFKPPANPVEATPSASPAPTPVARVLVAGSMGSADADKDQETTRGKKKGVIQVLLGWVEGVPEKHVVFPTKIEGVDEWDLVR